MWLSTTCEEKLDIDTPEDMGYFEFLVAEMIKSSQKIL